MHDEPTFQLPTVANDGSRFAAASLPLETTVPSFPATVPAASVRAPFARFALATAEESLVVDDRSGLTPAQMVESKLISRLRESSLPVSHLQMRGLVRNRPDA